MKIDPRLLRAYRALLGWTQAELAEKAGISKAAVSRLENEEGDAHRSTVNSLRRVFEKEGIDLFPNTAVEDVRLLRAARALLGLTQTELAEKSGIGRLTIVRLEADTGGKDRAMAAVQRALEECGVEFLEETATKGPGLRLRRGVARTSGSVSGTDPL